MRLDSLFVSGVAAACLCMPAAAMDIATYDQQRKAAPNSPTQVRLRVYLLGVGEGLRLANARLRARGQPLLFCMSDSQPLFAEDYFRLIDASLKEARGTLERQQFSIESILLTSLVAAHPCADRVSVSRDALPAEVPAAPAPAPAPPAEAPAAPASAPPAEAPAAPASAPPAAASPASAAAAASAPAAETPRP